MGNSFPNIAILVTQASTQGTERSTNQDRERANDNRGTTGRGIDCDELKLFGPQPPNYIDDPPGFL
eukprot:4785203-Amphidinium_carterae.1